MLSSPAVVRVLNRLHAQSTAEDESAKQRVRARETKLVRRLDQEQRYDLYGEAPLAITREVGELAFGGLVAADLSADDPDLLPYLEHVRDPAQGYFSITVPLNDGVELSTRTQLTADAHPANPIAGGSCISRAQPRRRYGTVRLR